MVSVDELRQLAERAHQDQIDPDGVPHFEHVRRVAEAVDGSDATAVALLHDVLEDTPFNAATLNDLGVPPDVIEAVELLTRDEATPYSTYLERIANGAGRAAELAREVKLADLRDNLRRSEAAPDLLRAEKYRQALEQLERRRR